MRQPFRAGKAMQVEYVAPRAMIPALQRAVKTMNHGEIRTVECLLVRVAGDFVAGMVLHRLLQWLPHSKRRDGEIWKSDKEWAGELGLSYAQIARVREVLEGVVVSTVRRAQGSPTYHYRVDLERLVERVAEVYGCTGLFARILIFEKVENGSSTNSNMEVRESQRSMFEKVEKPEQTKQQTIQQEDDNKGQEIIFDDFWNAVRNLLQMQVDREMWEYVKGARGERHGERLIVSGAEKWRLQRISRVIGKIASQVADEKITVEVEG